MARALFATVTNFFYPVGCENVTTFVAEFETFLDIFKISHQRRLNSTIHRIPLTLTLIHGGKISKL